MVIEAATYEAVAEWTEDTRVEYVPDAKRGNTKSAERYVSYSKARTIGEALALGSKPEDLLHDYQKKFLRVVNLSGAPKEEPAAAPAAPTPEKAARPRPQTPEKATPMKKVEVPSEMPKPQVKPVAPEKPVAEAPQRSAKEAEVPRPKPKPDAAETPAKKPRVEVPENAPNKLEAARSFGEAGTLDARQKKMQRTILLAESVGLDLAEAKCLREGGDTIEQMAERLVADRLAQMILERSEEEKRRVTNNEVRNVLQFWSFKKNEARLNVMPDGQSYVHSDTLGLVRHRTGCFCVTQATQQYPHVTQLLNAWLQARCPDGMGAFPATSISVNWDYAAKRHRDGNNAGPSMIHGFGKYRGGELAYWPDDDHTTSVDGLRHNDRRVVDISKGLVLFDGCRAHEVDDFEGERFSIVFFSVGKFWHMTEDQRVYLTQCGFHVAESDVLGPVTKFLPPPRGYNQCKSLHSMFGIKEKAKFYQWMDTVSADEEAKADSFLKTLTVENASEEQVARAAAAAQKLVKEAPASKQAAPEEAIETGLSHAPENGENAGEEEESKEAPSLAEMPKVKFGPLDQAFGGKGGKKESGAREAQAPAAPAGSVTLAKARWASEDLPVFGELSSEKKRARPQEGSLAKRPRQEWPENVILKQSQQGLTESGPSDIGSPGYQPDVAAAQGQRDSAQMLGKVLEAQQRFGNSSVPLTNFFRLVLFTAAEPQQRFAALLKLLAPAQLLTQEQLPSRISEVFGEESGNLLQSFQSGGRPARHCVLRALAHAFALTQPPRLPGGGAQAREFASASVRQSRLVAMERAVLLAFGDLGGACEELLEALMSDCSPAQLFPRCEARCGSPSLPMQPMIADSAEVALLQMSGKTLGLEALHAGTRVQVHRLGDCIAIYGPDQEDVASSISAAEVAELRRAIKVKACVIEAVLVRPSGSDDEEGETSGVKFMAFDCLWQCGRSLMRQSLRLRRAALAKAIQPNNVIDLVTQEVCSVEDPPTVDMLVAMAAEATECGCKGVLLKNLDGDYEAGCTSRSWLAVTANA